MCRGCDKEMQAGVDMVLYTYSHRNKGQHIFFCKRCVRTMNKIIDKDIERYILEQAKAFEAKFGGEFNVYVDDFVGDTYEFVYSVEDSEELYEDIKTLHINVCSKYPYTLFLSSDKFSFDSRDSDIDYNMLEKV